MRSCTLDGFFWKAIFGLLGLSCIFLFILSLPIPGLSLIVVPFMNNDNISIGNFEGVTRISYGTWMACYYNQEGSRQCTQRTLPGQPYTFTIVNNNTRNDFRSNTLWSQGLAIQLWGFISTLIVTAYLILYYYFIKRRSRAQIEANPHASTATPQLFRLWLTNLITAFLFIPVVIIIATEGIISDVMKGDIGGALFDDTDIAIRVTGGFWLNVTTMVLFVVIVALKLFFDRGYITYSTAFAAQGRA